MCLFTVCQIKKKYITTYRFLLLHIGLHIEPSYTFVECLKIYNVADCVEHVVNCVKKLLTTQQICCNVHKIVASCVKCNELRQHVAYCIKVLLIASECR